MWTRVKESSPSSVKESTNSRSQDLNLSLSLCCCQEGAMCLSQDSPTLCLNHHITEIYLSFCVLSGDPACTTGASGNVTLFFRPGKKKSKLPYVFFPTELWGKFVSLWVHWGNSVRGQITTMFSLRFLVLLNMKGRSFVFVGEKGQQPKRILG